MYFCEFKLEESQGDAMKSLSDFLLRFYNEIMQMNDAY